MSQPAKRLAGCLVTSVTKQPERGLRDSGETREEKEIQRGRYAGHVSPVEERSEAVAGEDAEPQHETEQ